MVPKKKRSRFLLGVEPHLFSGVFAVLLQAAGISLKLPVHNETHVFCTGDLVADYKRKSRKKKNRTSGYSLEIGASIVGKFMAFTGE